MNIIYIHTYRTTEFDTRNEISNANINKEIIKKSTPETKIEAIPTELIAHNMIHQLLKKIISK